MRPTPIVLLLAFAVSGCATAAHVRLAPEDRARLAGEAVAVVQDQPAGFTAQTGGGILAQGLLETAEVTGLVLALALDPSGIGLATFGTGLVGEALVGRFEWRRGRKLAEAHGLPDPALRVSRRLAGTLEAALGTRATLHAAPLSAATAPRARGRRDVERLRRAGHDGVVLVVGTTWQGVGPAAFRRLYAVRYAARARLVDVAAGRALWSGACDFDGADVGAHATWDGLRAGDAALLKARLDEAADACADTLARGLTTAQPGLVPPR